MAHCTNCGKALRPEDRFCGSCGQRTDSKGQGSSGGQRRRDAHVPALRTEDGMRTYQAILTEMDERTRQHRRVKLSIAAVAALWVLFRFWSENMNVGRLIDNSTWLTGAVAGFGALALLTSLMSFKDFTEEMYYRIPGSRDADGEHRCIHCGHRGIHHHGEYRSNEKFADCSKCKTNLWKS